MTRPATGNQAWDRPISSASNLRWIGKTLKNCKAASNPFNRFLPRRNCLHCPIGNLRKKKSRQLHKADGTRNRPDWYIYLILEITRRTRWFFTGISMGVPSGKNKIKMCCSATHLIHIFEKSSSGLWINLLSSPSHLFWTVVFLRISSPITAAGPPGSFTLFRYFRQV